MPARIDGPGQIQHEQPVVEVNGARRDRVGAEQGPGNVGATGADQSREADDLARAEGEADVTEHALAAQCFGAQDDRTARVEAPPTGVLEFAPNHQRDQAVGGHAADWLGGDAPAVAQHRDPIRQRKDFVELVGNEDDRPALGLQAPDRGPQRRGLALTERRRGLVHDDQLGGATEHLGDFDHLLDADRQVADPGAGIDVDREAVQDRARSLEHLPTCDEAQASGG